MQNDISEIKNRLSDIEKNLASLEELMRLIVTNQTSNNVEIKNFNEHFQQLQKAIDAESQNNSLNNKTISSLEELMRLIVANQMLNNVEIKKPPKQEIFVEEKPEKRIYSNGEANIESFAGTKIRLRLYSGCIERGNTFTFYDNNYIVRRLLNSLYKETDREVSPAYCYIEVIDFGGSLISSQSFSVGETIKFYRR